MARFWAPRRKGGTNKCDLYVAAVEIIRSSSLINPRTVLVPGRSEKDVCTHLKMRSGSARAPLDLSMMGASDRMEASDQQQVNSPPASDFTPSPHEPNCEIEHLLLLYEGVQRRHHGPDVIPT